MTGATPFHEPVLLEAVVRLIAEAPPGPVVDATVGGGGHAEAVLTAEPDRFLLGLDVDPDALAAAGERLRPFGARVRLRRASFGRLAEVVSAEGLGPVAAVLADLGVSSAQLDRPARGFSYREDGPLDMRMDPDAPLSARELVNELDESALAALLARGGEDRRPRRIARAIVAARPLETTGELAAVVAGVTPQAERRRGHPARRTFQALRIAVNDEREALVSLLAQGFDALVPGGRLVILTYHSGEDRLVRQTLRRRVSSGCTCPPGLPCVCGWRPTARWLAAVVTPDAAEVARNYRARSARLWAVERTAGSRSTGGNPAGPASLPTSGSAIGRGPARIPGSAPRSGGDA